MVELRSIEKCEDQISCEVFVEDCIEPISLLYDIKDDIFSDYELPADYSWCKAHMGYAKCFISKLKDTTEIPKEKKIIWF